MTKYSKRSETPPPSPPFTYKQIIWNNQKIFINGKWVFYKVGLANIYCDSRQVLLQEEGKFLSFKDCPSPSTSVLLILYQVLGG